MAAFSIAMATATPAKADAYNHFNAFSAAIQDSVHDNLTLSGNLAVGDHHPDSNLWYETLGNVGTSSLTISADYGNTITGHNTWSSEPTYTGSSSGITVGAEKTLTLNGLTFTSFSGSDVINYGTFNANAVTLNEGVTGTGRMIVGVAPNDNSVSRISSITQNNLTINNGAKLEISADELTIANTIQNNGTLALSAGTLGQNIANANLVTTTGAVTLSGNLSGNGSVTVGNGSTLTFSGKTNSNTINATDTTSRLTITNNGTTGALKTTGALNIATTVSANSSLTADANLIGGAVTNSGTLVLTKGATSGTTNKLSYAINNTVDGTLKLNNIIADASTSADANITNTTAALAGPNLIMEGDVTLISLMGNGKALLDARTVNTTLTLKGIRNENDISADTTGGNRTAKIIVDNDGVTNANNALTTTGKLLADTTINAGAAMIADADKLGAPATLEPAADEIKIAVTNNGKLALNGGADATHVKTGHADIANAGSITVKNHAGISGKLTGNGTVLLDANETDAYLTLNGTKNENTINREVGEGHTAGIVIQNEGVGNAAANAKSLVSTAALNADIEIADADTRVVTAANLLGRDLATGSMIVTNKGELVLDGGTLKQHIQGYQENMTTPYYGKTILRQSVEVAGGVELSNKLIVGDETPGLTTPDKELSGAGSVTAMDNTIVYTNGEISVKSLTVNNQNTLEEALGIGIGFLNRGTVSSKELTIGAEDGERYSVFTNTANGAKITTAKAGTENESLTITGLGVLKTAGTNTEAETINNNGYLLLTGATQNAVVGDVNTAVEGHPYFGTTINKAGASTIDSLAQGTVNVEAGSLTITHTAAVSDHINVKAAAATLALNGTVDPAEGDPVDPMAIDADIANAGTITTNGKIRFNGNVGGYQLDPMDAETLTHGTIMTAEGAELTLAGLNNTNIVAGNGKLIVKNTGFNSAESTIEEGDSLKMRTGNSLLIETEIAQNSALVANANALGIDGAPVSVTNNGALNLENASDADMIAYANIVNNGMTLIESSVEFNDITVDGNITNNGKIAVGANTDAILTGNLTNTSETAGTVTLAEDATLTLKGTQNTNDIFGSFVPSDESTLHVHNLGLVDAETDKSLTTTGKLFTNVQIDNGWLKAAADRLGGVKPEEEDPTTININNVNGTLALTGSPIPAPAEEGAEVQLGQPLIAYANITNGAGYGTMTDGHIRLNGNLIGDGFVDNSGVLVLGGTSNANLIVGTGELVIDNDLTTTGVLRQKVTVNEGKTLTANGADMLGAEGEGNTINVINNGTLALNNTTAAELTAHANIVNNGELHTFIEGGDDRIVKVDGNVANNGTITVSRNLVITGTLTGEVTDTTGKVNMADNATLTLLGTANTNDIRGNVANPATLIVTNTGVMNAENPADNTALVNTGKVFVNTTVTDASAMITAANLLGKAAVGENPATTIDVTNNGILDLEGDTSALTAYANITNAYQMNVSDKVVLNGNLLGAGTTTLDNNAELTLAGTSNANTIQNAAVEGSAGKLFITNTGVVDTLEPENTTALTNTGKLLVDTTITTTDGENPVQSKLITSASMLGDNTHTITVTNNGIVVLNAGILNSNITLGNETANIVIDGEVTSNVALAKATINATKQLTIAAEHVGAFNNAGTVQLTALEGDTGIFSTALTSGTVKLLNNVTFADGASFGNADSKADLNLNGKTLDIGTNTLTIGTLTGGDASTIKLTLLENATDATLVSTTNAVENVTLHINMTNVSKLDVQQYKLADQDGYTLAFSGDPYNYVVSATPFTIEDAMSKPLAVKPDYDANVPEFGNLDNGILYVLRVEAVAEVAADTLIEKGMIVSQNEKGAVQTLADDDVYEAMTTDQKAKRMEINTMLASALDANDNGRVKQILKEAGAEKAPAVAQSESANVGAVMNVVGNRLGGSAPAPAAGADHGRSGGNEFRIGNMAAWGQLMFNKAKLDKTDGFDSDSTGFALGFETEINDDYKAGIGYAFTSTDIKTDRSKTDVDTNTVFLYGEYKPNDFYVNSVLSYGWSSYDEKTKLTNIKADYDANTFGIQAMAGYTFGLFTPEAGLRYTNVKQKAYTNSLGVHAGNKTVETLTAVAGAKYAQAFQLDQGFVVTPEAKLAFTYDIDRSKQDRSISLANGSGYLAEGDNMERFGFEMGVGASVKVLNNLDIGLSYEGKFKKDYSDHTGLLNVKYNF